MDLEGKTALVTGGGTGLGKAISLALARKGVHLAINYSRSAEEAERTAAEIRDLGAKAITAKADVSNSVEVDAMVARVMAEYGRIDMLINNAGTTRYVPLPDLHGMKEEDWDRIMAVNVKGAFLCSRAVSDQMVARGSGKIINTASNSAFIPSGSCIAYMSSKAALVQLTRCLATALKPHVQVNAVAPSYMATEWMGKFFPEEVHARLLQDSTNPPADVDDVVQSVLLLATADSITGQTLVIDHGKFMH